MDPKLVLLVLCLPLALTEDAALQQFTTGNNLFASQVYTQLGGGQYGNFLISPLPAVTILALTYFGAKNATAEQLAAVLHLPEPNRIQNATKILQNVVRSNENYTLAAINKVYVQNDYRIDDGFRNIASDAFDAEVENVDFTAIGAATASMNRWVESRTDGKVAHLVSPSDLDNYTKVVLVNALYFKGDWSEPFTNFMSKFYTLAKDYKEVNTMQMTFKFNYYASAELKAQFLEMPFKGGDVTFTVVLPDEATGLGELEKNIGEVLKAPRYSREVVSLFLPKFRVESRFRLNKALQEMGVTKIFRESEADLSGLAVGDKNLLVNRVLQKSFVEVNEGGAEAAAASSVSHVPGIVPMSAGTKEVIAKNFVVNHPFIFYIKVKDIIAFVGRVVDPTL